MARAESELSMSRMDNLKMNNIHVMLVGPAGAGKSSLIKSLIQLCKSSDGSLPCDYSYIPLAGGGMLDGHTLMQQTGDSISTLTITKNSGWYDWSNKTAVERLTAQIRGEKPIDDVDWTDTERDPSPLKHSMVPHPAFSEVDCIAVVLNGQEGIEGIANHHGLVEACRQNTRRRPSFVITHKDTMSGEQIEHMKTALETEYGPNQIFFIENITTSYHASVDDDMKSLLLEFLAVCASDGKVGAECHRMRENEMLAKVEGQYKYEKDRMEKEIVETRHALDTILVTKSQLDDDTAKKLVKMLDNELNHVEELHLLKAERNKEWKSSRDINEQRGLENKWHQLQMSELQQKLQQSTLKGDCLNALQQQHEQMKGKYERERSDLVQKMETEGKLKDQRIQQQERETLKLRIKIQLESHRRSEEQKKSKKAEKSLRKKVSGLMASFSKRSAGLSDTCSNSDNLDRTDMRKSEEEQPIDEFAAILKDIADDLYDEAKIDSLGSQLGIIQGDIERALMTNVKYTSVTSDGTRRMLKQWRKGVSREDERIELRNALIGAKLTDLAERYFPQVTVAEDEDELDFESTLPNDHQEHDAKFSRTKTAVPTPEVQSVNMDIIYREQATNVMYAQGEFQITEEIHKTPTTKNKRKEENEEVQEIVTLREIKEYTENEDISFKMQNKKENEESNFSIHRMRGSNDENKHDRYLKMEKYEKMQGNESSHRITSSFSEKKAKRCICC